MNTAIDQRKQGKRLFRRGPSETTWPKDQYIEYSPTTWAPPWTCIIDANSEMHGGCYRGELRPWHGALIFALVIPHRRGWYWSSGDAEGISSDREEAKFLCDVELTRRHIALHEVPTGCTVETDEGPPVAY